MPKPATIILASSAFAIGLALRFAEQPHRQAKTHGIHPSFSIFARLTYAWLIVAGSISVWAAFADVRGGIWGASRHALTVGLRPQWCLQSGRASCPTSPESIISSARVLMFLSPLFLQLVVCCGFLQSLLHTRAFSPSRGRYCQLGNAGTVWGAVLRRQTLYLLFCWAAQHSRQSIPNPPPRCLHGCFPRVRPAGSTCLFSRMCPVVGRAQP